MALKRIKLDSDDFCSCKLGKKHPINDIYCNSCGKYWRKNADLLRSVRKNAQLIAKEREIKRNSHKKRGKVDKTDET